MPQYGKYHTKPQDKKFVAEFVKTGNSGLAAKKAYNVKDSSKYAVGHRKLTMPNIQAQITAAMRDSGIDPSYVVKSRKRIIDEGMTQLKDGRVTAADINKSLDGLERLMGIVEGGKKQISHLHLYNLPHSEVEEHYKSQHRYFDQLKSEAITQEE
jgi:hypothetical protein